MLESGNLLIRMKYDIALIEQATPGGVKPHSPKVMMLLVLAFTCNTAHLLCWETVNVSHFTLHCKYRFPSFVAKVRIIIAENISWQGRYRFYDISNVFERFHLFYRLFVKEQLYFTVFTENHIRCFHLIYNVP